MSHLDLKAATIIIDEALAEARRRGYSPMAVAVLDAGAHLVAFKREDDAGHLRPQIAMAKASGSLGMGYNSRELAKRANGAPLFYTALFAISGGGVAPSPGGVLIRDDTGRIIGAVGISGDTGDADEVCAIAGVVASGLKPDPEAAVPAQV